MISFEKINKGSVVRLAKMLPELSEDSFTDLAMMCDEFLELDDEIDEVAVTAAHGCVLVRICDGGEYFFPFPFVLDDDTDPTEALRELALYTRKESIRLRFTDLPRECLDLVTAIFPHVEAKAYEDDEDSFVAVVLNEIDLMEECPEVSVGAVTLSPLTENDKEDYAALCADRELNRYWGYDALADNPTLDPDYFLAVAMKEAEDGVALSLAVRVGGKLVGEAVIYNLDYRGSGEIAIRISRAHQGKGYGALALRALINLCGKIGLCSLYARVREENTPAISLVRFRMVEKSRSEGVITYFTVAGNVLEVDVD